MGEIIVIILLIVLAMARSNSKKQASRNKRVNTAALNEKNRVAVEMVRNARPVAATPAEPEAMSAQDEAYFEALRRKAQARIAEKRSAGEIPSFPEAPAAPAAPIVSAVPAFAQGASAGDDEGCVGGSLPHDHAEGESRKEHSRHTDTVKRREAAELLTQARAELAATERLDRMRQAVVMAEVLGRPKALRPKGQIRA